MQWQGQDDASLIATATVFFDTASGCFTQFQKLLLDAYPT